ncbi:MAG: photosynthetic reaction center cytochrome c subunit [Acetobacteraceae bacterium]|nr:MAG: photosynthetic reaction center cytochrome c subunit [Acetobacteraceae bacterium]
MSLVLKVTAAAAALLAGAGLLTTFETPPVETVQLGFRGLAMEQVYTPRNLARDEAANTVPAVIPRVGAVGPKAGTIYRNVQVLGDLSVTEFARTMAALTTWVSPQQGCNYCHNPANMASDEIYTKVVSRRMLQMVARINAEWKPHVQETGVTCYTCHRGNPVPAAAWTQVTTPPRAAGLSGGTAGQNLASPAVGLSSLPYDPFTPFLAQGDSPANIRVVARQAQVSTPNPGIKETEWTYGLMMHMSTSLGVNCTACHNSRAFSRWEESTPQRTNAWHGIRMVRDLNLNYITPLAPVFAAHPNGPANGPATARVGREGDPLKVNCATCHQGVNKPLLGVSMLRDYPELNAVRDQGAPPPIRQ